MLHFTGFQTNAYHAGFPAGQGFLQAVACAALAGTYKAARQTKQLHPGGAAAFLVVRGVCACPALSNAWLCNGRVLPAAVPLSAAVHHGTPRLVAIIHWKQSAIEIVEIQ